MLIKMVVLLQLVLGALAITLSCILVGLPKTGKWSSADVVRSTLELGLIFAVAGRVFGWW